MEESPPSCRLSALAVPGLSPVGARSLSKPRPQA